MVTKSFPSCDVRVPHTFSSTIKRGARFSAIKPFISVQKGQNVPERSPFRPAPPPASERSWHGNDAHARCAEFGRSWVVSEPTSSVFISAPPSQFSRYIRLFL